MVRLAAKHRDNSPCAVVGVDVAGGEEWFPKPQQQQQPTSEAEVPPQSKKSTEEDAAAASPADDTATSSKPAPAPPSPPPVVDLHTSHVKALATAQRLGLNITLHAGEDTNADNVRSAILEHGATRIGHG